MKNTNDTGSVSAETIKETLEKQFASGKEVVGKEYCSLCEKYMKPTNSYPVFDGVECNGIFVRCGGIPCKQFEKKQEEKQEEFPIGVVVDRAINNSPWYFAPSQKWKHAFEITTPNEDPDGTFVVANNIHYRPVAEHICKLHNDWRNFKMKNGEKKVKKGNLRRLENLAWRMKTFKRAFKVIEKNNYLGFDSIKIWIEQNEDDVNQWIFTKWLKNSSNYEEWTWFFHNRGSSLQTIPSNVYFELCDSCEYIDYFRFGNHRSMNGVPEGEWDSYTFHQEYESKLFADGKDFTMALVLEKMFDFAEEYVKHNGWMTAEMANKYNIDLKLVETNSNSDILLDKMDPATENCVRRIIEESDNKFFEKNPELKGENINFKKPLEQRVDNLEKMVKDIWTNVCADKRQA